MKKVVVIFLVLTLLVTMTGCQSDTTENASSSTSGESGTGSNASEGTEVTVTEEDPQFGAYPETITISTATSEYLSATYPEGDDVTDNVWIRAYKERFNIEVVTDWVSDEYDTKLNLAISSGELPDVFTVTSAQLNQLVEADMLYDMTDIFDAYASDRLKGYMDADYDSYMSGVFEGQFYGIPRMHWGIIDQPDYIWIRKDWKNQLGLEDPQSMDDVVNIAKAFVDNGLAEYGFAIDQTLDYLNLTAIAWNAHPDLWLTDDSGSLVYGSIQPEMKDAIKAWSEWYADGLIDPDFTTYDFNAMNEGVVSGNIGVQPFYQWWGYNPGVDTVGNNGGDAIFEPYLIPSAVGDDQVIQSISFANGAYTVVSKDCEHPEAVIKLLNFYAYMVDEAAGIEDAEVLSGFLDNDMAHVVGAFRVLNPACDYEQYAAVKEALETGSTEHFTTSGMWQKYNNSVDFLENQTPGATGDYMQQGNEKCAYGLSTYILDNELYIKSALWGASPESLLNYGSTLDDLLTEGFTKIIMGIEDIDYFDTVVENWKAAGGDTVTQEMNDMYGN